MSWQFATIKLVVLLHQSCHGNDCSGNSYTYQQENHFNKAKTLSNPWPWPLLSFNEFIGQEPSPYLHEACFLSTSIQGQYKSNTGRLKYWKVNCTQIYIWVHIFEYDVLYKLCNTRSIQTSLIFLAFDACCLPFMADWSALLYSRRDL